MYRGRVFSGCGSETGFDKVLRSISEENGHILFITANEHCVFITYEVPDRGE